MGRSQTSNYTMDRQWCSRKRPLGKTPEAGLEGSEGPGERWLGKTLQITLNLLTSGVFSRGLSLGHWRYIVYVDKILPIIDLTTYPTTVAIWSEGIPFNEIRDNWHTVDISRTTYLNRRNWYVKLTLFLSKFTNIQT